MTSPHPHPPPIIWRSASPADVPAIVRIEETSFVHAGERFGPRRVRYLIESPRAIVIVGEAGGQVLGWAAGFTWPRGKPPWGRIYALAVDPAARGRRLGPRLLEHIIAARIQRGATRLFLEVRPDNHPAVRLYERFGFRECKSLPNYYGHGIAARRMQREADTPTIKAGPSRTQ